jgi:hypothetical protein
VNNVKGLVKVDPVSRFLGTSATAFEATRVFAVAATIDLAATAGGIGRPFS